jgi:hypothetical protein
MANVLPNARMATTASTTTKSTSGSPTATPMTPALVAKVAVFH